MHKELQYLQECIIILHKFRCTVIIVHDFISTSELAGIHAEMPVLRWPMEGMCLCVSLYDCCLDPIFDMISRFNGRTTCLLSVRNSFDFHAINQIGGIVLQHEKCIGHSVKVPGKCPLSGMDISPGTSVSASIAGHAHFYQNVRKNHLRMACYLCNL